MKPPVRRDCWCGAPEAQPLFAVRVRGERFEYVRCTGCRVVALFPQPPDDVLMRHYSAEYYGASRKKFAGPIARFVSQFQQGRARQVAAELERHGPRARVLDVGCGNGGFLLQMKERGFANVEGTEWTAQSARRVPRSSKIPVHVGDLLSLPLAAGTYDAITMWHVFEHLRQPRETLDKCWRLLKPGGLLFLTLPNQESLQAVRYGRHWFHLDPPRHLHGFGPASLSKLLRLTQFTLLDATTFSFEQNPYGWIQSQLNAMGFPRERAYDTLKRTGAHGMVERLTDVALLGALTPWGVARSVHEALVGKGGTLNIVAEKE